MPPLCDEAHNQTRTCSCRPDHSLRPVMSQESIICLCHLNLCAKKHARVSGVARRLRRKAACAAELSRHHPPSRQQQHTASSRLLTIPASCTKPGSKTNAGGGELDHAQRSTRHQISRRIALTTARCSSSAAGHSQLSPASSQHKAPRHSKLADPTREWASEK